MSQFSEPPAHSRKRPQPPTSPDTFSATLPKRSCPDIPPLDPHLAFLDELYELDNTSTLDPASKEELVSEMMRSLEMAIGSMADHNPASPPSSQSQAHHNGSLALDDAPYTRDHGQTSINFNDGSDGSGFQSEFRQFLEACDDELGMPGDSIASLTKAELERPTSSLLSSGDTVPSWLLDDLEQFIPDPVRDLHYYEAVNQDFHL